MMTAIRSCLATTAFALELASAPAAEAGPYTALYVFGDSTVDTGNVALATGGTATPPPYFDGRFSDGPVWVETLATGLGLAPDVLPSLAGGRNFAWGTARIATTALVPSVLAQVDPPPLGSYPGPGATVDPGALYVIAAGSNDMRDARTFFPTTSPADVLGRSAAAASAVSSLGDAITSLAAKGARNFLIPNLVDLGITPEAIGLGVVAASSDATQKFNALLPGLEASFDAAGLDVTILDLFGLANAARADALLNAGGVFGITNVFTPCGAFTGSIGISCDVSLFSDGLHSTARANAIVGDAALRALDAVAVEPPAAVPTPASAVLLLGALAILSAGSRGRSVGRSPARA